MKTLNTYLLLLSGFFIAATTTALAENYGDGSSQSKLSSVSGIDASDSIVFELSQSIIQMNIAEFPVYFASDDSINAVDFSFKFDQLNFQFDTIIRLFPSLQITYYFNVSDSTLRFTSNCLQTIPSNTSIIKIRFTPLTGQTCVPDLTDITTYLNGDVSSSKVVSCIANDVSELEAIENKVEIYPNPAVEYLNIKAKEDFKFMISNALGEIVIPETILSKDQSTTLETGKYPNGVYFFQIVGKGFSLAKKIMISR